MMTAFMLVRLDRLSEESRFDQPSKWERKSSIESIPPCPATILLPGREASGANPWIRLPLATAMGEGRNVLVVRSAEAVIAVGGSWGTLSEIALARKIGRPVILLGKPPAEGLDAPLADDAEQAVAWALQEARDMREPADTGGFLGT